MLRPVSFQSLDEALPLLAGGFPSTSPKIWSANLRRLQQYGHANPTERAGFILTAGGRDVGVILTIPSARRHGETTARLVNLSSWYIEAEHRWRAPRMLQQVVSCRETLYTDLTPTEPVRAMIGHFGFRPWSEGTLLFMLPWFAIKPAGESSVIPLHRLPSDAFAPDIRDMLTRHAAFDCIAAGLWDGHGLHPLIFARLRRRGIPVARLIYADSRATLMAHMPAIARFLLQQKMLLLAVNGDRHDRIAGSFFTERPAPAFFKGASAPPECDLAFSEFVFLKL